MNLRSGHLVNHCLPVIVAVWAVTGCQNFAPPHQSWTEAEVVGRVVDVATRAPLGNASVTRVRPQEIGDAYAVDKGAKQLQRRPTVATTEADGQFTLAGERTANLFLESFPDYSVTLKIQYSGYETLQRQFTNVVQGTPGQAPRIEAGEIELMRRP